MTQGLSHDCHHIHNLLTMEMSTNFFPDVGIFILIMDTCPQKLVDTKNVRESRFCCTNAINEAVTTEGCAALEELDCCGHATAIIHSFQNKCVLAKTMIGEPYWS